MGPERMAGGSGSATDIEHGERMALSSALSRSASQLPPRLALTMLAPRGKAAKFAVEDAAGLVGQAGTPEYRTPRGIPAAPRARIAAHAFDLVL